MRDTGRQLGLAAGLQAMISAGDGLAQIALASRVYERTHAAWAIASVFLAITVPVVLLAPPAGLLLDRLPPKRVLVGAALTITGFAAARMDDSVSRTSAMRSAHTDARGTIISMNVAIITDIRIRIR